MKLKATLKEVQAAIAQWAAGGIVRAVDLPTDETAPARGQTLLDPRKINSFIDPDKKEATTDG